MCKDLKLIFEVNGYSHNFKTEEDKLRNKELAELEFTTLRFSDDDVMKDLPNVQRAIEAYITAWKSKSSPYPLQRGTF